MQRHHSNAGLTPAQLVSQLRQPSPINYDPRPKPDWKPRHRSSQSLQVPSNYRQDLSPPLPQGRFYAASDIYRLDMDPSYPFPPGQQYSSSKTPTQMTLNRSHTTVSPPGYHNQHHHHPSPPTRHYTSPEGYYPDEKQRYRQQQQDPQQTVESLPPNSSGANHDPYNARRYDPYTATRQPSHPQPTPPQPGPTNPYHNAPAVGGSQPPLAPLVIPGKEQRPDPYGITNQPIRARTYSQPDPYPPGVNPGINRAPTMNDPQALVSPTGGRTPRYPNPNDPFTVVPPNARDRNQYYPLTQTVSNVSTAESSDSGHGAARQQKKLPVHACLSLGKTDRLTFVKFPHGTIAAVRSSIEKTWPKGIQKETDGSGALEIQLRGNPWNGSGDEAVPSRQMMCGVLSALYHQGWTIIAATDISKKALDKDLLIFRETPLPPPAQFFAVSFNESDKLRLIGAPHDVINAIKQVWGGNVQKESWKEANTAWEFKLQGYPWAAVGDEAIHVSILLLNTLDALTGLGWELYTSLDMTAGPGGPTRNAGADTDCWIMKKARI